MEMCWDNIKNIKLTKKGNFYDTLKKKTYYYHENCKCCGLAFLSNKNAEFCSKHCSNKINGLNKEFSKETRDKISKASIGRVCSEETRDKISEANTDRVFTEESKKKMSEAKLKLSGDYYSKGLASFDIYAPQLEWCEEVRRNKEDPNILEVKCFKCGKWFIPNVKNIHDRIQYFKGNYKGNYNIYCSDECKNSCSIFRKSINTIMREDAIRAGRLSWIEMGREMQPELRKMVLKRDEYQCIKCGATENLICHHILPVATHPLESADIDNCITLCKECHDKIHKEVDGYKPHQLRIEEC